MMHHRRVERLASLGWPPALMVEDLRDRRVALAATMKFGGTCDEIVIGAEPIETGHRPNQPMRGSVATVPMARDADLLGAVDDFDQDSLKQQADERLPLLPGCGLPGAG